MMSDSGKQIITIHALSNILQHKGNHAIKFNQLIEYKMRNIFLDTKYGREASPRLLYKK